MLHPRHENPELVKALGGHHDNIVSRYTVWAITENEALGLEDLGIDIRNIEQQPPNVRAWLFRLIALTPEDAERYFEYVELGTRDPAVEARAGLALGLRDTYFNGIEVLVLDWFTSESDLEVSHYLLDHMVKQASNCPNYEEMVLDVYEKEPTGSSLRERMEAAAAGTVLYGKFKRMDGSLDLFRGVTRLNPPYAFLLTLTKSWRSRVPAEADLKRLVPATSSAISFDRDHEARSCWSSLLPFANRCLGMAGSRRRNAPLLPSIQHHSVAKHPPHDPRVPLISAVLGERLLVPELVSRRRGAESPQSIFSPSALTIGVQSATSAANERRNLSGLESGVGSIPASINSC
jgi:hypothetical protein